MNQKEIKEIKRQFTAVNQNITRIAVCYINEDRERVMEKTEAFLSLPEEVAFKYLELFQKALSGKVGKNLFTIHYPTMDGGCPQQRMMEDVRKSRLEDLEILEEFFDLVRDSYRTSSGYMILLTHGMYDIPGKDGEVYEYIQCLICPVCLSNAGLTYDMEKNRIHEVIREKLIGLPADGFLYPAFQDRSADINQILYYAKKCDVMQDNLLEAVAGGKRPMSTKEEAELFGRATSEATGGCTLEQAKGLFQQIAEIDAESCGAQQEANAGELAKLLESNGFTTEQAKAAEKMLSGQAGAKTSFNLSGLLDTKALTIKTSAIQVKADPIFSDGITACRVNGRLSLVIPLDESNASVNGIEVNLGTKEDGSH